MIEQLTLALTFDERLELDRCEHVIREGEHVFITVGNALLTIRDKHLYRENGRTFEQYLTDEWPNISRRRAYQLMDAAVVAENVKDLSHPLNEWQALTLNRIDSPNDQRTILQRAVDTAPNGKVTAAHIEQTIKYFEDEENDTFDPPIEEAQARDLRKMRTNTGLFTSATPEWYTPHHIIDRVIELFGEIDLDPCSNAKDDAANVPALNHYTVDDDGLAQPWLGRVYMNPPYGDEIGPWVARLVQAYQSEEITDAVALLPGRTDTAWFQPLFAYPICFVRGRLKFSGSDNSATFPSVIVYLGIDLDLFKDCFEGVGSIMLPFRGVR